MLPRAAKPWRPRSRGSAEAGSAEAAGQPGHRVDRIAATAYLEVEVRTGRGTGRADPADDLPTAYRLPDRYLDHRLVAVAGGQVAALVRAVRDAGVVAVPAGP